jgi:hypothetical protein
VLIVLAELPCRASSHTVPWRAKHGVPCQSRGAALDRAIPVRCRFAGGLKVAIPLHIGHVAGACTVPVSHVHSDHVPGIHSSVLLGAERTGLIVMIVLGECVLEQLSVSSLHGVSR